jgi:large conductance mechanosensitive channel
MQHFIQEFKAFAMRGNVVDLAIAVIIGTAFNKIVASLVDTIIMPIVGIFIGGVNFSDRLVSFGAITLKYGVFVQSIIDFVIIAFVIFVVIKLMNRFQKPETTVVADTPAVASEETLLLREIRDILQQNRGG